MEREQASFRDPAGFMYRVKGRLYRQVNQVGREDYDLFRESGLYDELVKRGWIIPHDEVKTPVADKKTAYKVLAPRMIEFISYPYEWSFSQYKDAALLTLKIQRLALDHGLQLKDASAYNIQFYQGRPVLIDTLSFERYHEGDPWTGYRQFCQHFLGPLVLMAKRDLRLSSLTKSFIDGIPLDLTARLLPKRSRFSLGMQMHLYLHAVAQDRYADTRELKEGQERKKISRLGLIGIVESLEKLVKKQTPKGKKTEWDDYYENTNYSEEAFLAKTKLVESLIVKTKAKTLWDLGGNNGVFSRLASNRGIGTVSFDIDPNAIEESYLEQKEKNEELILPLVYDLANPSPALGWACGERMSLEERGPVDCLMALALIHHLAISNNFPLGMIAEYFSRLAPWLIIEFVPKEDSQVKRLLKTRPDIFPDYHQAGFERAFGEYFSLKESHPVEGSERVLYLLKRRK